MDGGFFYIISAGDLCDGDLPVRLSEGDFLCAADAGYLHLLRAGQRPGLVIGDFDSMEITKIPADLEHIILPEVKDDTDTIYAVREGFRRGYRKFRIFGALGGIRVSHSIANIQLLTMIRDLGGEGELLAGTTRLLIGSTGSETVFEGDREGFLSVFSLTERSEVSIRGMYYTLDHGQLTRSYPLGVSNHFTGETAVITVHLGEVLFVEERVSAAV